MDSSAVSQIRPITAETDIVETAVYCDFCDSSHEPVVKILKDTVMPLLAEFVASSGTIVKDDGEVERMSMEKFAHLVGWTSRTLYYWMDADKTAFNTAVFDAMNRVHSAKRVARVMRGVFVEAAKGKPQQAELYLRHFWPNYKAPKEEREHTYTGLAELYKAHQATQTGSDPNPAEGVIVENAAISDGL